MTHAPHQGDYRIFADNCEECVGRTGSLQGLAHLDPSNLRLLGDMLREKDEAGRLTRPLDGASYADMKAIDTLRIARTICRDAGVITWP